MKILCGLNLLNKLHVDPRKLGIGGDSEEPQRVKDFNSLLVKFIQIIPNQPYLQE